MAKKLSGARVSDEAREVFEAMQFLRRCGSQQDLLGPVLEAQAAEWRRLPEVGAVLEQRAVHDGRTSGTVRQLNEARHES